ncbi:MAG: hypothetical protein Q4E16_05420 [Neisseria sp.]|nr:hypothetical protein [Neisseria sp.]
MDSVLEKLEQNVFQLTQKYETLLSEKQQWQAEIQRLLNEQAEKEAQHQAAVDELSEALLVQVGKLKNDLQDKISQLTKENQAYRQYLSTQNQQVDELLKQFSNEQQENTDE